MCSRVYAPFVSLVAVVQLPGLAFCQVGKRAVVGVTVNGYASQGAEGKQSAFAAACVAQSGYMHIVGRCGLQVGKGYLTYVSGVGRAAARHKALHSVLNPVSCRLAHPP